MTRIWSLRVTVAFVVLWGAGAALADDPANSQDCPYEKLRPVTTTCPSQCMDLADATNAVRERITEINKQIAEIECARRTGTATGGGTSVATDGEPENPCPEGGEPNSGSRHRFGFIYRGDTQGKVGSYEQFGPTIGRLFDWSYDTENFSSLADMISQIDAALKKPIDKEAFCGDCVSHLVIYQHGAYAGQGDNMEPIGQLSFGDLRIDEGVLNKRTGRLLKIGFMKKEVAKLHQLAGFMCTGSTITFAQCDQGSPEGGEKVAQAIADEMGVSVMAPTFEVPFGSCPPTRGDSHEIEEGRWKPFDPRPPGGGDDDRDPPEEPEQTPDPLQGLLQARGSAQLEAASKMSELIACHKKCAAAYKQNLRQAIKTRTGLRPETPRTEDEFQETPSLRDKVRQKMKGALDSAGATAPKPKISVNPCAGRSVSVPSPQPCSPVMKQVDPPSLAVPSTPPAVQVNPCAAISTPQPQEVQPSGPMMHQVAPPTLVLPAAPAR